jgi:cytochrome c oxidase subunit 2
MKPLGSLHRPEQGKDNAKLEGESTMNRLPLSILAIALAATAAFPTNVVRAQPAPKKIAITAKRFGFTPSAVTVKKGEPVVLVVTSADVPHGLRFRELNLDLKIPKGGTAELPFTPEKTGDFVGHCSVFCGSGHGGMMLTLHVVE